MRPTSGESLQPRPARHARARRGPSSAAIAERLGARERISRFLIGFAAFSLSYHLLRLGDLNLSFSDIALFGCLVLLVSQARLNAFPFGNLTFLWCGGLVTMLGGLIVSSIVNGDPSRAVVVGSQYLFAYLLLPMIIMSYDRIEVRKLLVLFVFGVSLSQVCGILVSYTMSYNEAVALFGPGFLIGNGRIGAFAGEANWNAAMVAGALPILVNAVQRRVLRPFVAFPCGVALLWGLFASASVTGLTAALLALGIVFIGTNLGNLIRFGFPVMVGLVSYVALDFPLPQAFQERVGGALGSGDLSQAGTFVDRSELIVEAWQIADDTLLLGVGVDQFRLLSSHGAPVHNFPLIILTEGGFLSLCGLVMIFGILWSLAFRSLSVNRADGMMAMALLAVLLIFSMAIPHMFTRLWVGPVLLALGVTYARAPKAPRRQYQGAVARSEEDGLEESRALGLARLGSADTEHASA